MDELLLESPAILRELMKEFVRRGDEEYQIDSTSQLSACFLLAIRSASLLGGILRLLTPQTRDSAEVLFRAFLESRDLLLTFRFDHKGTRDKIGYWFAGNAGSSWKAEHFKCEKYMDGLGHAGTEFARRWSMSTTLAHPTKFAAQNSAASATLWAASPPRPLDQRHDSMELHTADYLTSVATLIILATHDLPDLVSLRCDLRFMPNIDSFREQVFAIAVPILGKTKDGNLPPESYRSKAKS
jgi:hypothetical protein